jgi:hypothetical protein
MFGGYWPTNTYTRRNMPAYPGTHINIDLTIKVWRIPIRIKGTVEPLSIMKSLGEVKPLRTKGRALSR